MTASPHEFLHPAGWKPALGYANGVAAEGRTVFVGGMIGWKLAGLPVQGGAGEGAAA